VVADDGLLVIGERINPGFKSSEALFDNSDIDGIQALAIKQAEAGASYLNINIGMKALTDLSFMVDVIKAIQEGVDIPLSFDFPNFEVQEMCLNTYDKGKAGGRKPIVNSISEHREEMFEALRVRPTKVIVMASERMEDGIGKSNKEAGQVYGVVRRITDRLVSDYDMAVEDIIVDVSITTLAVNNEGLIKMVLDAAQMIQEDKTLRGIHMMGGISNVGMLLPKKRLGDLTLQHGIERSFLTVARPRGFDMVLGTPWHCYEPLPEDNFILQKFLEIIELKGTKALKAVRDLYTSPKLEGI